MKESKEIIDRLDRLESKQAISDLVSSYGTACDQHDMKKLIGLFTENAEYDSPNGSMKCVGKKNIEEMFIEIFKTRGPSFHWTHDLIISIKCFLERDPSIILGPLVSNFFNKSVSVLNSIHAKFRGSCI